VTRRKPSAVQKSPWHTAYPQTRETNPPEEA
jgi:hypothetical protein